jgi:hypothetical protein
MAVYFTKSFCKNVFHLLMLIQWGCPWSHAIVNWDCLLENNFEFLVCIEQRIEDKKLHDE